MRKLVFLFLFLPVFVFSAEISDILNTLVEQLAEDYAVEYGTNLYSRQTVSIIEIRNTTKEAEDNYVGEAVEELLKNSIADSLVFKLIDRKNLDIAMNEIKLSLSGLTDDKDSPELGKIRGVKLLLDGSVTLDGDNFIINIRLTDVETTAVIASASAEIPKKAMIETSNQIAYEYVTANGIGLSFFITPTRYLVLNESPPVRVGDNEFHSGTGGARLTYRLNRRWKFSIDMDVNVKDVFFDKRTIGSMENLTAFDDVFNSGLTISGFWEKDGSFSEGSNVETELSGDLNYYTLTQAATNVSFMLSYVYSVNQKFNISAGIGPHINWLRYQQTYDNVPILINEGVAFKRYEVVMNFLGLGGTANINFEYFVLPRFALNFGITGFYSYILPRKDLDAWSPTTGEYYYETDNYAIESFGLNPFMMPDGRYITEDIYPANHIKVYAGASVYF